MKKIYVLDRIEEGTAILISDDEEMLKISPAGDLAGHKRLIRKHSPDSQE